VIEEQLYVLEEKEEISDRKAKIESKNTFMGKYYAYLLHKGPMKGLLIAGGLSWWWIPLSIGFIGPIGLVFIALILPFIPYILYGILIVILEMNNA